MNFRSCQKSYFHLKLTRCFRRRLHGFYSSLGNSSSGKLLHSMVSYISRKLVLSLQPPLSSAGGCRQSNYILYSSLKRTSQQDIYISKRVELRKTDNRRKKCYLFLYPRSSNSQGKPTCNFFLDNLVWPSTLKTVCKRVVFLKIYA